MIIVFLNIQKAYIKVRIAIMAHKYVWRLPKIVLLCFYIDLLLRRYLCLDRAVSPAAVMSSLAFKAAYVHGPPSLKHWKRDYKVFDYMIEIFNKKKIR